MGDLDGKKDKRTTLRLTESTKRKIELLSSLTGIGETDLVRLLIDKGFSLMGTLGGNDTLAQDRQRVATQPLLPTFAEEMAKPQMATTGNSRQHRARKSA